MWRPNPLDTSAATSPLLVPSEPPTNESTSASAQSAGHSVWEQDSSADPISLLAEYTALLLILVEVERQQELLEIEGEQEE